MSDILTADGVKHAIWDAIHMKFNLMSRINDHGDLPTTYDSETGNYSFNKSYGAWVNSIWFKDNYASETQEILKQILINSDFNKDITEIEVPQEGTTDITPITTITDKTKFINAYVNYFMSNITLTSTSQNVPAGAVSTESTTITIKEHAIVDAENILQRIANVEFDLINLNIPGLNELQNVKYYESLLRPQNLMLNGYDEIMISSNDINYDKLLKIATGDTAGIVDFSFTTISSMYHYSITEQSIPPDGDEYLTESTEFYEYTITYSSLTQKLTFIVNNKSGYTKEYDIEMIILDFENSTEHVQVVKPQ